MGAELWHWLLKPGSQHEARPDPGGTPVLIMVTRGALAMTVDGQTSHLAAGTAGHIVSGTGYVLANPALGRGGTRARAHPARRCPCPLHHGPAKRPALHNRLQWPGRRPGRHQWRALAISRWTGQATGWPV
jgi:hypothetical protein